jgi:hypothetical protein
MTRISSFGLYKCPKCGQVHIKPEYGSISIYIPPDPFYKPTDLKACKGCHLQNQLQDYKYLGLKSKTNTKKPFKIELAVRKLIKKPYIELDVRKIYPKFDD